MKRTPALLCLCILAVSGCAVFGPAEREEAPPEAAARDVPETAAGIAAPEWTVKSLPQMAARVEFSGGDAEDAVKCGISFYNSVKAPKTVTAALLVADGELYPLEGFIAEPGESGELRISAPVSRQSLLAALKAETLYLIAVIDRIEYQFEPDRNFAAYKNQVLKNLASGHDLYLIRE
jgi:hypothetical protein